LGSNRSLALDWGSFSGQRKGGTIVTGLNETRSNRVGFWARGEERNRGSVEAAKPTSYAYHLIEEFSSCLAQDASKWRD